MQIVRGQQINKPSERCISVVFALDDSFFINLAPCIQSLLEHASLEHYYDLIVLSSDLSDEHEHVLKVMIAGRSNVLLRVFDVSALIASHRLKNLKTGKRLSSATYFRFFIPQLLGDYDKVLYLDGDTIIMEDVAVLYHTDISDFYAAAVVDANIIQDMSRTFAQYVKQELGMADPSQYVNAGVMLFNLNKIRKDFDADCFFKASLGKSLKHHDQDVLNSLLYGNVLFLPHKYNVMWLNRSFYEGMPECEDMLRNPAIIHYAGGAKPFCKNGAYRQAASYYWQYAQKTPCYDSIVQFFLEDCSKAKRLRLYEKLMFIRCIVAFCFSFGRIRRHYRERIARIRASLRRTAMIQAGKEPEWIRSIKSRG